MRARGRGYGTRAQRLLAEYLFAHTQLNRVEAETETGNLAEQRALEKADFTREGILRGACFRDGHWRDMVSYSMIRSDLGRLAVRQVAEQGELQAGPSSRAFSEFHGVPLWRDTGPGAAAARLSALAEGYGGSVPAGQIRPPCRGRIPAACSTSSRPRPRRVTGAWRR